MDEKDIRQISIRLPSEVYQKAMESSKRRGMSFNSFIAQLVSDFFEKESETFVQELVSKYEELERRIRKLEKNGGII